MRMITVLFISIFLLVNASLCFSSVLLCLFAALQIQGCDRYGWISLVEDKYNSISCVNISNNVSVVWTLTVWNGSPSALTGNKTDIELGTCTGYSCNTPNNATDIHRGNASSVLKIRADNRHLGNGTIRCSEGDNDSSASCALGVIHEAETGNCTVWEHWMDKTVKRLCTFTKYYDSNGIYQCRWKILGKDVAKSFVGDISLFPYSEDNELQYYRGTCSFTDTPSTMGNQTLYSVDFHPWGDWKLLPVAQIRNNDKKTIAWDYQLVKIVGSVIVVVIVVTLCVLVVVTLKRRRPRIIFDKRQEVGDVDMNTNDIHFLQHVSGSAQDLNADATVSPGNRSHDYNSKLGLVQYKNKKSYTDDILTSLDLFNAKVNAMNKEMSDVEIREICVMNENDIYETSDMSL